MIGCSVFEENNNSVCERERAWNEKGKVQICRCSGCIYGDVGGSVCVHFCVSICIQKKKFWHFHLSMYYLMSGYK